jgi:hypothetical protein
MNVFNKNLYLKFAEKNEEKRLYYINIIKMNQFLIENHITSLFKAEELFKYMQVFLQIKSDLFDDSLFKESFLTFFEKNLSADEIKEFYDKLSLSTEDFNFNFSSIALLINIFSFHQESTKQLQNEEKIKFFYEDILGLKNDDDVVLTEEKIEDEKREELTEDYIPESETLNKAKENFGKYSKDDIEFVNEFLVILDKILPPEEENILLFSNEYDYPTKKIFTNAQKPKIPKFPVEKLAVEIEEEKEHVITSRKYCLFCGISCRAFVCRHLVRKEEQKRTTG